MNEFTIPVPIIASVIAGAVSLLVLAGNAWLSGHRERTNRQREVFSKAFSSVVAYEEFPYVVRRRRADRPEEERIRISTELRKLQEDISYYSAWVFTESAHVSKAYATLISNLRRVAGGEIAKAWCEPPAGNDLEMNMPDLGLGTLKPFKQAYLEEVVDHLSVVPRWIRRSLREIGNLKLRGR